MQLSKMRPLTTAAALLSITFSLISPASFAAQETAEDTEKDTYSQDTTHNPLTGSTTKTTVKKNKRKVTHNGKGYTAEDEVKVKQKTSSDGKKTSVQREENTTETQD